MTDLSKYTAGILTAEDRPLFQEAEVSALHGAPRGAYILIWIACAEGLKRKFREAAVRDGQANKMLGEIIKAEDQQRSADRLILAKAKDYSFIDDVSFQKLEYIYKMRCVYGHPYEAAPNDEEITNAAAVVVSEVLGKPTLLRHGFVQSLVEKLFSDVNYLQSSETSVRAFAREMSVRIAPAVYGYALEKCVEKLEALYDDASLEIVVARGLWFLSEFLLSVGCQFYSATQWHDFAAKYPKTAQHVIFSDRRLFEAVGERASDYIVSYNITEADTRPSRLKEVEKLLDDGLLSDEQKKRLQSLDIWVVRRANLKISTCYDVIISALESRDWYKQNPAIDFLEMCGRSEIATLSPEHQEELGRNILQAADGSARSASAYLLAVCADPSDFEQPFLKGLIFEAFVNENLEFRFKEKYIPKVLDLLIAQRAIETELGEAIHASKPKSLVYRKTYLYILDLVKQRLDLPLLSEALERNREKLMSTNDW